MSIKVVDNGGPAFPWGEHGTHLGGASLRDYFAAKALHSAWATWDACYFNLNKDSESAIDDIARLSYQMADAMLKARQS